MLIFFFIAVAVYLLLIIPDLMWHTTGLGPLTWNSILADLGRVIVLEKKEGASVMFEGQEYLYERDHVARLGICT